MTSLARLTPVVLIMLLGVAPAVPALDREALSPEAQALLPEGTVQVVRLKDGAQLQGIISRQTADEIVMRIQQSGYRTSGRVSVPPEKRFLHN